MRYESVRMFKSVLLALSLVLISSLSIAQTSPPVYGNVPINDEPVVINSPNGPVPEEQLRVLLWPALFSASYAAEYSVIGLSPVLPDGSSDVYLMSPPDSAYPLQKIGTFIPSTSAQNISWLPAGSRSESNTLDGVAYSITQSFQCDAAAGFLVTNQGQWAIVSGVVTNTTNDMSITGYSSSPFTLRILGITATYSDATDANDWVGSYAASPSTFINVTRGVSTPKPTNCPKYRDCAVRAFEAWLDEQNKLDTKKEQDLANLDLVANVVKGGGGGALAGGGLGLTIGLVGTPVGSAFLGGWGAAFGVVIGSGYGIWEYIQARNKIWSDWMIATNNNTNAYNLKIANCKDAYGNLHGECAE